MFIQLRHSANSGNAPTALANGELAINIQDQVLYYRHANGAILELVNAANPATGGAQAKQTEVDFGPSGVSENTFVIIDSSVTPNSILTGTVAYTAPTGKDLDEVDMDRFALNFGPGNGQFTLHMTTLDGDVSDKFKINYVVG